MKKIFLIICFSIMIISLSGCTITEQPNISITEEYKSNNQYEYKIINNEVKLTKYIGEYRTLVEIPEEIDGLKVIGIQKGCFVKTSSTAKRYMKMNFSQEDNEVSDISTYVISDNIESIEDGAFDDNSTFITENKTKPNGWIDSTMQGSGKDGSGNVYYDTKNDEVIVSKGIVYVKDAKRGGIIVARCLTQRKEVEIPAIVDNQKVVDIGREAFSYNDKIEKIILPYTIGEIFQNAFFECSNLKEIIFQSTNLSRLLSFSFYGCVSLDIVQLPSSCTYLAPQAFADCGTISILYMPYSMVDIASGAFYNTTIDKIIYSGTEEQFKQIKIASDVVDFFSNVEIEYATSQEKATLERLHEINNYYDNTFVEFEGVITGFYNKLGVYVTDPETGFSIWCYNQYGLPFYDVSYIGRKVKVSGTKIHYLGQLEVAPAEIELIGEEKIEIIPIELDLSDANLNINDYLGYYVVVRGEVSSVDGKITFLTDSDIYLYSHYVWPDSKYLYSGITIEVVGWVHCYNQVYEILYDSRLIVILESEN